MITKIIFIVVVCFATFQWFRISRLTPRIILAIMLAANIILLLPLSSGISLGAFIAYLLSLGATSVFALAIKGSPVSKRAFLFMAVFPVLVMNIFGYMHWPYSNQIGLMMIIPVCFSLALVITEYKNLKDEAGLLAIVTADAGLRFFLTLDRLEWFW